MSKSEALTPRDEIAAKTDRELLEEIAMNQRKILATVEGVMAAAAQHPMLRAMMNANGVTF